MNRFLKPWYLAFGLVILLTACAPGNQKNGERFAPLGIRQTIFKRVAGVCSDPGGDSLRVDITSLTIDTVPDGLKTDSLSGFIARHSFATFSGSIAVGEEALYESFSGEFEKVRTDFQGPCNGWTLTRKIECLLNADGLFSVSAFDFSFTGGAHPNTVIRLKTYDLTTGQPVNIGQMIDPALKDAFLKTVEKTFRNIYEIADTTSWQVAGFWFDKGFTLPGNMALTPDGLYLIYNQYEVAPYSTGTTELIIPAGEFSSFLTSEWKQRFQTVKR